MYARIYVMDVITSGLSILLHEIIIILLPDTILK